MVFLSLKPDIFFIYKIIMRIGGVWPLDRNRAGSLVIFSLLIAFQIVDIVTSQRARLGICPKCTDRNPEVTYIPWLVILVLLKLILRNRSSKMTPLIYSTIEDWSTVTDPDEREIMIRHDKFGSLVLPMKYVIVILVSTIQLVLQLVHQESIDASNINRTWEIVIIIFFHTVETLDFVIHNTAGFLFWSFAMHISSQFTILKNQFQEFLLIKKKAESRKVFRRLVDRHTQLLDLCSKLEDSFGCFVGLQIVMTQIMICLCASRLGHAIKAADFKEILVMLLYIGFALSLPAAYYLAGDYLTASCEGIGDVFLQCNWYDLSKDERINYSIVIARSRRSKTLTLWNFHRLNLVNLQITIQSIYSYVSLIVGLTME